MIKEQIFWHDTVEMPSDKVLTPLPEKVEVAIIGGGYTGLAAARTLARHGLRVVVLEAQTMGWGASSRNGGMTRPGLKAPMSDVIQRYGWDSARTFFRSSLESVDAVEQIIQEEGIQCGFARRGHLVLANKPSHYAAMVKNAEFMEKEFGHPLRLVPRAELQQEIGSSIYYGGEVDEFSGGLNPAQYVAGLARAAEKAGALLCARAGVTRLERSANGFVVTTARGKLRAERVLAATSGYTGSATPGLRRKIIPIGSFIIATAPLSRELADQVNPHRRMFFDYKHYLNYFRLSADNRMIFGGRAAFFPETQSTIRRSAEILRREMVTVYPQLKDIPIEYVWGGTLDFTFDLMPHVGEIDGVYYALGYAGHGVALATYLGKTTAEALFEGRIKDHPFASISFPGAPLGIFNGQAIFWPFAGLWYKILDWLE